MRLVVRIAVVEFRERVLDLPKLCAWRLHLKALQDTPGSRLAVLP